MVLDPASNSGGAYGNNGARKGYNFEGKDEPSRSGDRMSATASFVNIRFALKSDRDPHF